MQYKDTLNLPKTDFPMRGNLAAMEPRILAAWQDLGLYRRLRKEREGSPKFVLHDGPPYANGLIHIGHALNKILKDIIIKYKILRGYDCPFIAGWDCHGLPVEHQLFKELKLTKHDVDIVDFRKKAKAYALKFVKLQAEDFKRLGIFSDWDKPYLTVNPDYEFGALKLLEYLIGAGYIYRGRKPVNWCSSCETALAEAEVEYLDKKSDSTYLLFKDSSSEKHFLVWTTTPWTLISNVAVAVHPEFKYALIELSGRGVIVAQELIPILEKKLNQKIKISRTYIGKDLDGLVLEHPFLDRSSKVVLADFVSSEEGSGCVHIAPGHGQEDFSLVKKYSLDIIMPVDDKGIFQEPDNFKGKNIKEATEQILDELKRNRVLVKHEEISHSYPHCWRCKQPIIFRATFQWFLSVDKGDLRKKVLKEVERVNWVPSSGKERMKSMVSGRPDWCLSRQRLWGIPIPAVKCRNCKEVALNKEIISRAAEVFKKSGSDSWFNFRLEKFIPKGFKCPACGHKELEKEFDILDVWFESGASFAAVLQADHELSFPADLYLEGSDQHRGWFQVSLLPSVAKEKIAPFKAALTHGFVVDADGRKMSKSLGNVIAPQNVTKRCGAEILRLWAASTDYSEDVKISEGIIKQLTDNYRKVRNTIRFILGNIADFDPKKDSIEFSKMPELDKFMCYKLLEFTEETTAFYDEFSFYKACQKIFNFCNLDLSSFYLDILKDRLYTFSRNSSLRRSSQTVLYHSLEILLKLIAPVLSFTAEEAYQCWPNMAKKQDSVFIDTLACCFKKQEFSSDFKERWERITRLRTRVLKDIEARREEGLIGGSLQASLEIKCRGADFKLFKGCQDLLREVFIVSQVKVNEGDFKIITAKAEGKKCLRCWNWSESVGSNNKHSDICARCVSALEEGKNDKENFTKG